MTADTEALRECPFCGGKAMCGSIPSYENTFRRGPDRWRCVCNDTLHCCLGPDCDTREAAISAWNRRAPAAPWEALGEAVDAVLNESVAGTWYQTPAWRMKALDAARSATVPK